MKKALYISLVALVLACGIQAQVTKGTARTGSTASELSTSAALSVGITTGANAIVLVGTCTDQNGVGTQSHTAPTSANLTFSRLGGADLKINSDSVSSLWVAYTTAGVTTEVITGHWTEANDGALIAQSYTGTAGTAGNNGTDAIGANIPTFSNNGSPTSASVTVNSTSHNNSLYAGFLPQYFVTSPGSTAGTGYTEDTEIWDTVWAGCSWATKNAAVTPAANTVVNYSALTLTSAHLWGIEILVAGAAAACQARGLLGVGC